MSKSLKRMALNLIRIPNLEGFDTVGHFWTPGGDALFTGSAT